MRRRRGNIGSRRNCKRERVGLRIESQSSTSSFHYTHIFRFLHSSLNLFFFPPLTPSFSPKQKQQLLFLFLFSCFLLFDLVVAAGSGATAMQSQLVCNGCRSLLLYPRGATNVCCALCNTITSVPPPGMEMSQLYCGGCRTLLMYTRGATSVRCSCCHTVNLVPASNQVAHVHCGNCRTTLMYPYGAPSVKCALCHYITNVS
ncbi:Protein LOL1, partial [Mucuna pruriens]